MMTPIILDDAELDHLGEIYLANPAWQRMHVSFEQFILRGPWQTASDCQIDFSNDPDVLPLLSAQERVRIRFAARQSTPRRQPGRSIAGRSIEARLECALEAAGCECRDGQWFEKLTHHTYPRKGLRRHAA